ncbi:hypothetical protein HOK51_08185 [Candidatus Woesearchaeota archaeon]|jgi:hypothetical protein|nr:hypothetical protein [Candidatus Woesearchaeota archaeon]MBT6519803.1 hypothetical protein [Candidatus Woesearchaeota archaeon]MBT7368182.1 hypothetical protein [Candidatus Woesearchaeota archaeon]
MLQYNFWKSWKRKTQIEEAAIDSLKVAKKAILSSIPPDEIVSIYVKGSFIRREMNQQSDVDTVTIVKHAKYLDNLRRIEKEEEKKQKLNKKKSNKLILNKIKTEIRGYAFSELKTGRRVKNKVTLTPPPRFVKHLPHYKLIYGKDLNLISDGFLRRTDAHDLKGMIWAFENIFLPGYVRGEFLFSQIIKQIFWLVEFEQKAKDKSVPHNWKLLAKSISDNDHVVKDAIKFRLMKNCDKELTVVEQKKFIKKLKKYLKECNKFIK